MSQLEDHLSSQGDAFAEFFWHRLRWRAVADYLPADGPFTLVDIGAGTGHFGGFVGERFPQSRYLFVEPIESLESELEARFGTAQNARRLPNYAGAQFITMLDVLEHQADDTAFLRDVVASCDAGTTLILSVPASEKLWSDWDVGLGHYRRYTRRSLSDVFAKLPVEVFEVSYLFPELMLPGLLRAWKSRRAHADPNEREETFPELPRSVNRALYLLGSPSVIARRSMPFGTSLIAAGRISAQGVRTSPDQ